VGNFTLAFLASGVSLLTLQRVLASGVSLLTLQRVLASGVSLLTLQRVLASGVSLLTLQRVFQSAQLTTQTLPQYVRQTPGCPQITKFEHHVYILQPQQRHLLYRIPQRRPFCGHFWRFSKEENFSQICTIHLRAK